MKTATLALTILVALTTGTALAQDGSDQPEPFDMEGAIRKVGELLKESERLLVESLQPGASPEETAKKVDEANKAMDDLLSESRKNGQEASKLMADIVKNAPQQSGSGSGDDSQEPQDKPEKDPGKKPEDEVEKKDPKNSEEGDPERGEEKDQQPNPDAKKPVSAKDEPVDPDLAKEWLATLPPEVRKAFENRNWDAIPPKWREVIRKYMKELAETESGD